MAAEASVALMHRITNIRLPGPLPGDGDQRYAIDLDDQGLICRIEAMEADANEPGETGTTKSSTTTAPMLNRYAKRPAESVISSDMM